MPLQHIFFLLMYAFLSILIKMSFRGDLHIPENICLVKVNKRNTRKRRETCSKLTMKTSERNSEIQNEIQANI